VKVNLRSTEQSQINIPSKIWNEIGWKLNDTLHLIISEVYADDGSLAHTELTVAKEDDLIREDMRNE